MDTERLSVVATFLYKELPIFAVSCKDAVLRTVPLLTFYAEYANHW